MNNSAPFPLPFFLLFINICHLFMAMEFLSGLAFSPLFLFSFLPFPKSETERFSVYKMFFWFTLIKGQPILEVDIPFSSENRLKNGLTNN